MDMSDAIKEAYAHAPQEVTYYDTLEIMHASFTESIKVVVSDAPLTTPQGEYLACPNLSVTLPETEGGVRGQLEITIPFLPRDAQVAIKEAAHSRTPVTIKYRQYLGENIAPDAELPVPLQVESITQTHHQVTAIAMFPDLNNASFPRRLMTALNLPGGRV